MAPDRYRNSRMARRVVVTGIGAVSPNGVGRENFWRATRSGTSGVRRITRFDPAGFQVQIAGEVADLDEAVLVEPKDRPHVSRCVPLGVAAAREAIAVGGVDAPIAPLILRGFMVMRILTSSWNQEPERGSRPFSRDRSGFVLGEGAWFFVMEEYEHARARGAQIYGEVAGYASTCEAYH